MLQRKKALQKINKKIREYILGFQSSEFVKKNEGIDNPIFKITE